ncbi:DUF1707 domain-containing protein [Aeromicrobium sp. NPDC092404]|uniref:DUF1707 SHOCT-like domain-containing protein n=1 Tax=Aeromicrobium sp. NPDC092404 TaxID=3154976 RepID=UPI0034450AB6
MAETRASDADRDSCLEDIEVAFADGRINDAEREERTQAALQATTLSELAALVDDLGPDTKLPSRVAAVRTPKKKRPADSGGLPPRVLRSVLVGAVVLAVITVAAWISSAGGDDGAGPGATTGQSVPKDRLELHTAEGFEQLVELTRNKFGTTRIDSAAIYPDYASITIVTKDDPRRTENWYFAKGFGGEPSKGSRTADAPTVDLASIDATAYAKAIKRSPTVLGVEDVNSTYAVVRAENGQPAFSVYVRNEYNENGYWTFSADGTEIERYAFE